MLPLGSWTHRLGEISGRLAPPANFTPTEGEGVFVLGSDVEGVVGKFKDGDFFEVMQTGDLLTGTPVTFVRGRATMRPPTAMPPGVKWRFIARVDVVGTSDGTSRVIFDVEDLGKESRLFDLAVPTRGQVAIAHSAVAYRLELEVTGQSGTAASVTSDESITFTANATTNELTAVAHGLEEGQRVYLSTSGTLPAPLVTTSAYYVIATTDDTFKLSLTLGGAEIDITSAGTGTHKARSGFMVLDGLTNQEPASVGRVIDVSGAASAGNNGQFVIVEYISAASVKVANIGGVAPDANNGTLVWSIDTFEVELPGVYVDSIVLDTTVNRPEIVNRIPYPNETGVRVDSNIEIEITDPNVSVFFQGQIGFTEVYVDGVLAYTGNTLTGTFQPGFDGPESSRDDTIDGARGLRLVIDPTTNFDPLTTVNVQVFADTAGVFTVAEWNYSFETEDLIAPALVEAQATGLRTVKVTFSQNVKVDDPTATDDALNPANWAVTRLSTSIDDGLPSYLPTIVSVNFVGSTVVELVFDDNMTGGAQYQVTVENVEDVFGNTVSIPTNVAAFYGYACPVPAGRRFELLDMLPAMNREEDYSRDLEKFIKCFQEVTNVLLCDIDDWTRILDPDTAPEEFVDAMLYDLGNPFDFDLSLNDKRRLIRVLVPIYQQKGTEAGIINACRFFVGVELELHYPAFEGMWLLGVSELGVNTLVSTADAHTRLSFQLESPVVLTDAQRLKIIKIALYMKDARTHLIQPIIEPEEVPPEPDHWALGLSNLGVNTHLH